jgi:citrate lyase subunit beta/citryl-CoA lyase
MIETAPGVSNLKEIAEAARSTRLTALVLGPNDLTLDLRLKPTPGRAVLVPILSALVVAARAHRLAVLDGVYADFDDQAGFEAECRQGRDFGFDGKTLIHPGQIEAANRIFSPSHEEIAQARAVVRAFAAPEAQGKGAIRLDGRMIERLHLVEAERTLWLADV